VISFYDQLERAENYKTFVQRKSEGDLRLIFTPFIADNEHREDISLKLSTQMKTLELKERILQIGLT